MLTQLDPRLVTALKDENFMRKLDEYPHKVKYARITSLTWDETPIEQIEGKVTGGTANLDGESAVRSTCSLTLEAQAMDIHDYYWGLKTKFKLEIGLENVIDPQYPDIIWFNQGIYVFTQFNSSVSPTGYTFSVSGKDKMCLLDGSMGGSLPSSIDFGKEDIITYNYKYLNTGYEPSYCWIPYEYSKDTRDYAFEENDDGKLHRWDLNNVVVENNEITYTCKICGDIKEVNLPSNESKIFTIYSPYSYFSIDSKNKFKKFYIQITRPLNLKSWELQMYYDSKLILTNITTSISSGEDLIDDDLPQEQPIKLLESHWGESSVLYLWFRVPVENQGIYNITFISMIGKAINDKDKIVNINFEKYITDSDLIISKQLTIRVGNQNYNNINYSDYRFKKILYDRTFSIAEITNESTVFQAIREKTPRENALSGGYYYNINKFPYVFQINSGAEDKPIYFCFDRDEIIKTESIPIKRIIKEAVHKYANEPYHNIILSDLDITGQELLEYRGSNPVYLFYNTNTHSYSNINFYDQLVQECDSEGDTTEYSQIQLSKIIFKTFNYLEQAENDCTYFRLILPDGTLDTIVYQASQILYGETIGYRETPLTYAGELVANVGESLTSILDKIKNMLGEYEYFYNVDGQFVFQRKQTYLNNSWNTILSDTDDSRKKYVMPAVYAKPIQYQFVNNKLFTSMNNNPQLSNIKNDFAVWGTRKGISGIDIPIHFRIGIQSKPTNYINYNGIHYIYDKQFFKTFEAECDWAYNKYGSAGKDANLTEYYNKYLKEYLKPTEDQGIVYVSDWRELIYQMAVDNFQHGQKDDFLYTIEKNNPTMHLGKTGYEQYYEDMLGFWRDVYDPAPLDNIKTSVHTWYENNADNTYTYTYSYPPYGTEDKIVYTSKEYFEPDYNVNMNYQLQHYNDVVNNENSSQANYYCPTRKATSFNVEYEYVTRDDGYYCQTLQGAKAYLQLLNGKEITVLNSNGAPLFQKTNESIGTYVSETYVWKHTGDDTVWFLIKEDGYHRVMVKQNGTYYHAYSYYSPVNLDSKTRKNYNTFYTTTVKNGKPYIDIRDIYYDEPFQEKGIDDGYVFEWERGTNSTITRIPHTSVVKSIEENKNYDAITNFNVAVTDSPELLNFWIELIDPNESSEFYNYKIENIGVRGKAITDSGVKAIYYKETPNVMFINKSYWDTLDTHKSGYTYIQIPDYYTKYFSVSSQGKTTKDTIDELLYQFTGYNESITLTSVPIYHLPLNSLIQIADKTTDINGDYIVNRISLPLAYNGMMNINASRAIRRII